MRILKSLALIILVAFIVSCNENEESLFDQQAHRGGRGLMPENTIVSEKNAIDYNCTMEFDLEMSKDKKIVVSHDAYFNSLFCLTPQGDTMTEVDGLSRLLYDMPYDSIKKYDCGSKPHPDFPMQKNIPAVKPLLTVLLDSVETYGKLKDHINRYNIELKSNPKWDGKHYPSLEEYVDSAMNIIERKGIATRVMIQSFDVRALRMVHDKWPDVKINYLVSNKDRKDYQEYITTLGFKPDIFMPDYRIVTQEMVDDFQKEGIKVIPGVPNELSDLQRMKDMGVDGILTDYPDRFARLK